MPCGFFFPLFLYHGPRSRVVAELLDHPPPLPLPVQPRVGEPSQVPVPPIAPLGAVRVLHDGVGAAPLCAVGLLKCGNPEGAEVPPELLVQPRLVLLEGDNVGLSPQAPTVGGLLSVGAASRRIPLVVERD